VNKNSANKTSSVFVCQQCGYQSPQFLGKCPNCESWNSLVEEVKVQSSKGKSAIQKPKAPVRLADVKAILTNRISTGISELDLVLGGGLVPGMAVLLSGEPGIGKSTLLLQLAANWSNLSNLSNLVLYVAGEESASQIKIRAQRLGISGERLVILETTDVDEINDQLSMINAQFIIVDSIQTLTTTDLAGTAGSVGQVRECASRLILAAKQAGIPLFLVGHVTKDGAIAGPKVLEHAVDTILNLEGEKFTPLRLLRTSKNRFGPTDEVGVFEMGDAGLKPADLSNLSNWSNLSNLPGSCLTITMEGTRPMLAEIQALVTSTLMPNPRRVASGVNYNRLQTIVAILQKRLNLPLYKEDIYVSVSGGLKIEEPAADLAIALAILSSYKNKAVPEKSVAIGELDLLGNVRVVNSQERRVKEARKLGFKNILISISLQ
jgi:DNA repair protein RadA/Sms